MTNTLSRRDFMLAATVAAACTAAPQAAPAQSVPPVPKASDDPQYRTVAELIEALTTRKVSAVELLELSIKRIESLDKHINAVVVRDFDRARAAAQAADQALARGERRPLLGIPMTVKESFDVAGLPTTWGIPAFRNWHPAQDAVTVSRLKAAGAVIIGKTNVPVLLADTQSYNPIYGVTNNPYDIDRTPGGSSGGSAASLAAGYVALEIGSDIGGSIRTPAHFCGVYGHKPTLGIIPIRGHTFPRAEPLPSPGDGLSVVGPLARTARDIETAVDVLAGADELRDGVAWRLALPPPRHKNLSDHRVLIVDKHPIAPVAESIVVALDKLGQRLERSGVKVSRSSALLPDIAEATRTYIKLLSPVLSQGRPASYYEQMRDLASKVPGGLQSLDGLWLTNTNITWQEWNVANRARIADQQRWHALFRQFDAVLCPVMPVVAYPHNHASRETRVLDIDGKPFPYINIVLWAGLATAAGLPATVAPIDRTANGLPIGVQIIGPMFEDRTPIELAALMEREYGGFVPPVF